MNSSLSCSTLMKRGVCKRFSSTVHMCMDFWEINASLNCAAIIVASCQAKHHIHIATCSFVRTHIKPIKHTWMWMRHWGQIFRNHIFNIFIIQTVFRPTLSPTCFKWEVLLYETKIKRKLVTTFSPVPEPSLTGIIVFVFSFNTLEQRQSMVMWE